MEDRNELMDYLQKVKQRMEADGFRVTEGVPYDGQTFKYVAERKRCVPEWLTLERIVFILVPFESVDRAGLRELSRRCFRYGSKTTSTPPPLRLIETLFCFPVAIVDDVDPATAEAVHNEEPPRHCWRAQEMPVVCALRPQRLYYFEGTPLFGALLWDYYRSVIVAELSP